MKPIKQTYKPAENRRREERTPIFRVEARLGTAAGSLLGMVRDISRTGAFIETKINPPSMQFQLTFLLRDLSRPLQIRTLAEWVRADAAGIGVKFLAIEADDIELLKNVAGLPSGVY